MSIPIAHIADLHVQPSDLVKIVQKPEVIIKMTNEELQELKEVIDAELNYRENGRWKQ